MRCLLAAALLLASRLLGAQDDSWLWKPEPSRLRLELRAPAGGWCGASEALRIRLVEASDPRQAPPPGEGWAWRLREERAFVQRRAASLLGLPPAALARCPALPWAPREDEEHAREEDETPVPDPAHLVAVRRVRAELEAAEASRRFTLLLWLNGELRRETLEVNRIQTFMLEGLQGENRLECRVEGTELRELRSWWQGAGSPRLRVRVSSEQDRWGSPFLLLEPGGRQQEAWSSCDRSHPSAGTYTLRYRAGHGPGDAWEDRGPRRVRGEVILDPGTDRARTWVFEALALPGAGDVLLGSFDVES